MKDQWQKTADLGKYRYFRMRINPSLTTADGGSSFILTSVPSSRQILWLLVTVAMQQQQRKVWGVLVTTWNELAMCVWGWEVWKVRGGLQFYKLAGVRGQNTFSSRWRKEDKKKERKKKKSSGWSLTKGKKRGRRKAQAGQTWLWHFPNPLWHTPDVWQPGTDGEGEKKWRWCRGWTGE